MTPEQVHKEVEQLIAAQFAGLMGCNCKMEGDYSGAAPDEGATWARATLRFGQVTEIEQGRAGTAKGTGILFLDFFTPKGEIRAGLAKAVLAASLFRRANLGGAEFGEPMTNSISNKDKWEQTQVQVAFHYLT